MDEEYKPTAKGLLIPIFRAGALILFLTLVMLIGGELNQSWDLHG